MGREAAPFSQQQRVESFPWTPIAVNLQYAAYIHTVTKISSAWQQKTENYFFDTTYEQSQTSRG